MKKLMMALAAGAMLAGCQDEARRFGYTGRDLLQDSEDEDTLYFTDSVSFTNWVPSRVMSVVETYPFTEQEEKVYQAFGSIRAGETLKEIPAGYAKRDVEPWFVTWTKDRTVFGEKGTLGFMAHCDPDGTEWETGDVFFSTYHDTIEDALEAMKRRRAGFTRECKPLRFHDFPQSFVAEYRRLRVITLVGRRAQDGKAACMTSIADKNNPGLGEWLPIDEQQDMLDDFFYARDVNRWSATCQNILAENHKAVMKAQDQRNLSLLGLNGGDFTARGRSAYFAVKSESFEMERDDARRDTFFGEALETAAKDMGVCFGEVSSNECGEACYMLSATGTNDLFNVCASAQVVEANRPDGECRSDGETTVSTNGWRVLVSFDVTERLQSGYVIPPRPKRISHRTK